MSRFIPLGAKERTAAKLLDMSLNDFRAGVDSGELPDGKLIAGKKRWDTKLLELLVSGELIDGHEEISW